MAAGTSDVRRRRLGTLLAVALVVLVLEEGFVRLRSGPLPEPQLWSGPEMQVKEDQIDALAEAGGASLVFIGSSHVDAAANASEIALAPGSRPAYNAATGAASLGMIDVWAREMAVPALDPDVVVLGLQSRELNPNDPRQHELERNFRASPRVRHLLGTETFLQRANRIASDVSYLVRYRTQLRELDGLRAAFGLGLPAGGRVYGDIVADDGQYEAFLPNRYAVTEGVLDLLEANALHDFEVGEAEVARLRGLVDFLVARADHVIVVSMPVTQFYVDAHEGADYATYLATMRREAEAAGATFVDAGVWPEEQFSDPAHTNAAGSARFTALMADHVTFALASPTP